MPPPAQHPSAQLCADYRVGDITPGAALAMATHLAACASCCLTVQEPAREPDEWALDLRPGALAADAKLPPLLRDAPIGRWRRIRGGIAVARVEGAGGLAQSALLVRAAPGVRLALPADLDILVALAGSIAGDWGELSSGGLIAPETPSTALADPQTGFLGLAIGADTLYQGFLSRLFS